jgi:hypothetical protein
MTTHVVCLDGTGQTRLQANPTNVALIFNAMGGTIIDADNGSFESARQQEIDLGVRHRPAARARRQPAGAGASALKLRRPPIGKQGMR